MYLLPFLSLLPLLYSRTLPQQSDTKTVPCSFQSDNYSLSWLYDELSSDVVFRLTARSDLVNFWSGLYIGDDKPHDVIGVFVRSGQIGLVDAHVTEDGIESDNQTNVQALALDLQDGLLSAEFARPLSTQDSNDADLANCVTFFLPVVAPALEADGPITVPSQMETKRVCNLAENCKNMKSETEIKKREDAPVCEYMNEEEKSSLKWRKEGGNYVFTLDHPAKKGKWWSAVGVGQSMQDLDLLVSFTENGKSKSMGGYHSDGYGPPKKDKTIASDAKKLSASVKNSRAHVEISVPADFVEQKMVDGCVTLQVALLAGKYGKGLAIRKHETTPVAVPVCGMDQCGVATSTGEPAEQGMESMTNEEEENEETNVEEENEPAEGEEATATTEQSEAAQGGIETEMEGEAVPDNVANITVSTTVGTVMEVTEKLPENETQEGSGEDAVNMTSQAPEVPSQTTSMENDSVVGSSTPSPLSLDVGKRPENNQLNENGGLVETAVGQENGEEEKMEENGEMKNGENVPSSSPASNGEIDNVEEAKSSSVSIALEDGESLTSTTAVNGVEEIQGSGELVEENENSVSLSTAAAAQECEQDDLDVCEGYFNEYIGKVEEWSMKHNHTLDSQMWKACKLLREVKNVSSMCCHRFTKECQNTTEPSLV